MLEKEENDTEYIRPQNSGEIILPNIAINTIESKDSEEQIDQDKVIAELQELKVESTNVAEVLGPENIGNFRDKDKYNLIKFNIKVKAVYLYEWEVYKKLSEIKKNLEEIYNVLSKNFMEPTGDKRDIFTDSAKWTDETISSDLLLEKIKNYYTILFGDPNVNTLLVFKEFFNISVGSFNQYNSGSKPFEGYCYKKADPQCLRTAFSIACKCIEYFAFSQYNLRWIVVKDDCIYYMDKSNSDTGKNVYFFDKDLLLEKEGRDIIKITNLSRSLILKFKTAFEREIWYKEINRRVETIAKILSNNPYKSYTNEKKDNKAHWFADGEEYFKDLAEKLMQAKETIFITDWWLSPEVWLTRPVGTQTYMAMAYKKQNKKEMGPYSRLMDILYQCANKGVKVYVLVYAECSLALTLNSCHSQHALESLHPNIQVERHPLNCTDLLWSHHEKLVIIDQIIGYVGGLDLCWGRWDTHSHPIFEEKNDKEEYSFPGIDYSNARIRDFDKVEQYLDESCNREQNEIRMPWHDVHSRLIGPVVADIARHFVERWNFSRFGTGSGITDIKQNASVSKNSNQLKPTNTLDEQLEKEKKPKFGFMQGIIDKVNESEKEKENSADSLTNPLIPESEEKEATTSDNPFSGKKMKGPTKLRGRKKTKNNEGDISITGSSIGTKVVDFTKKKGYEEEQARKQIYFQNVEVIDEDHLYVRKGAPKTTPNKLRGRRLNDKIKKIRMAHEKSKQSNTANDSNKDINSNSNANITEEENTEELKEGDKQERSSSYYNTFIKRVGEQAKTGQKTWFSKFIAPPEEKELETNVVNVNYFQKGIKSKVQVLRSACKWSVGLSKKENSILQAYYRLIDSAKHYIYIENQFFVSRSYNEEEKEDCEYSLSDVVENLIAFHIRKRIERAYLAKEKFRVFVFIPLLPGFAGEPESSGTLQIILKHTYSGISRNHGMSIIEKLSTMMGDKWKEYIGFYSLRGHGMVKGEPRTELIYIHSKLMIIDDKTVLLGSANINDRSMLGTRDSEYAVIINEKPSLNSKMDGQDYRAANFAYTFRCGLFAEHLGIDPKDDILKDPLSDKFLECVQKTAQNNTIIYRNLWGCYPDDEYKNFKDIKNRKPLSKEELLAAYNQQKSEIKGHAVEFPLHFLENENLGIAFFSVENLVPEKNFT